jgi:hypothetical protein
VLAEVDSSQAVLATLAYRIASYWVPLLAGPVAYGLFRMRYRKRSLAPSPREGDDPRPVPAHDRRVSTPDDDELGPVDYLAVEFPAGA